MNIVKQSMDKVWRRTGEAEGLLCQQPKLPSGDSRRTVSTEEYQS